MPDLSVTDVQNALREQRDIGHDMISHPGGLVFDGKHYPMAYAHGLEIPSPGDYRNIASLSIIPVSESGNVALLYSSAFNGKHTAHSTTLMNPHLSQEHKDFKHWYTTHPEHEDLDVWTNPELSTSESISKMAKSRGRLTTSVYGTRNVDTEPDTELPLSRIHEHNPAEAAWNTVTNNMVFTSGPWVPHPKELDISKLGKFIHVRDTKGRASYLYHPESEKMIKL